jgi:D-alanine--poly(phosphoribitol) ligase subunit 1
MNSKNIFQKLIIYPLISAINQYPNRNAFCIDDIFFSYRQLGECISKIRDAIKDFARDDIYIGLVANDDIETYASIFALWLEGKAYIPLHPKQPLDRCEEIIKQTNIISILDSSTMSRFLNNNVISTSSLSYKYDYLTFDAATSDNNIAYILFTSGSTGVPKGVSISTKNVGAFMDSFWECEIMINEYDKCLQCFDLTFDVSVQCFLAALTKGACVFTVPHHQIKYSYIYGLLEDHQLTFGAVAPSMLRYLKPYFDEINVLSLKNCILTGEASPADLVRLWEKCIPNATIYNFYGPTEVTIYCTYYKTSRNEEIKSLNGMLSIGKTMKNVRAIVIDEKFNVLQNGQKGELCVCGDQVSPGYWNSPEKNLEAFFDKEYDGKIQRFYRTGDLCFFDNKNELMLFGRLDSQAKIQGYRVELGEIEYQVREFLKGNNAVVLTFINSIGNTELALFIEGEQINTADLLNFLKTKLPSYMIPTKTFVESAFPLNANSKVDKRKLKEKIQF